MAPTEDLKRLKLRVIRDREECTAQLDEDAESDWEWVSCRACSYCCDVGDDICPEHVCSKFGGEIDPDEDGCCEGVRWIW